MLHGHIGVLNSIYIGTASTLNIIEGKNNTSRPPRYFHDHGIYYFSESGFGSSTELFKWANEPPENHGVDKYGDIASLGSPGIGLTFLKLKKYKFHIHFKLFVPNSVGTVLVQLQHVLWQSIIPDCLFIYFNRYFYSPAQLVRGFTLSDLLLWTSRGHTCLPFSPLPPRYLPSFFVAHVGFSVSTFQLLLLVNFHRIC